MTLDFNVSGVMFMGVLSYAEFRHVITARLLPTLALASRTLPTMQLYGIDFTSAPTTRKSITVAAGRLDESGELAVTGLRRLASLTAFEDWLQCPGPWLAGCDFPFGLPHELLVALDWPHQQGWASMINHLASLSRPAMVEQFRRFCAARPVGGKFAHRATDVPAGSSPSMKWVNPPVAFMLHAGAPRLLAAGVHLPGLHDGDRNRVALEAYPGLLARSIIGRTSYKSDDRAKQNRERELARASILSTLGVGALHLAAVHGERVPAITCRFGAGVESQCLSDPSGDYLDAVLCLAMAAWAWQRRAENYGLPAQVDCVEGWIISAKGVSASSAQTKSGLAKAASARNARS
jgi:Protein of unknown function (DUF429)